MPAPDDDEFPDAAEPTPAPKATPAAKPAAKPAPDRGSVAAPDPAPKAHTHSPFLTKKALALGASQDWLDATPSAEVWEEIARFEEAERRRAAAEPEPRPAAKPEPAKPPADEDEEYLTQLAEVDPKLARLIKKSLAARDDKAVAELKEKVAGFELDAQKRQARAMTRALDDAFAALPEKFHALVGVGPIEELADPGEKGWRGAIYQAAGLKAEDGRKAVAAKVAAAAEKLAGAKVQDAPADPYGRAAAEKPKRPAPPKDPETGRFTPADFANGHVQRPNGRKAVGVEELPDAEVARRVRQEHGVARDRRAAWDDDDDDLPE